MRRFLAVLAAAAALAFGLLAGGVSHGGDAGKRCILLERWAVKTLADKDSARIDFRPEKTTVSAMGDVKRIPPLPFMPRQGPEFKTFEVTCRIESYNTVRDGDLNLTLVDPDNPDRTMIAEVPSPDCLEDKKSPYAGVFRRVWGEFREIGAPGGRIIADFKRHKAREGLYTITGVGFIDIPHLQEGAAPNYIELHPVLSIRRANLLLYGAEGRK